MLFILYSISYYRVGLRNKPQHDLYFLVEEHKLLMAPHVCTFVCDSVLLISTINELYAIRSHSSMPF